MLFSSYVFLFVFFPLILALNFLVCKTLKQKNIVLTLFSLFFYAYGGPKYLIIMIISIMINYFFGLIVDKFRNKNCFKVKIVLGLSVFTNLSILCYFKYYNFFVENLNNIFNVNIPALNVVLPIGISFYTFQAMSYVIDIYRGNGSVQKNPLNVALYISLFPQLIAGPIVRYETIANQINERKESIEGFVLGFQRFVIGFSKKLIIANTFAEVADNIFNSNMSELTFVSAWIAAIAYSFQIYFDFSGYSDMAIGLGRIFGFHFLENFNYPYVASSITDFWRRWHISLSTWFRDYVYIPLGGNRKGSKRQIFNILIVWILTGFWHGASWNYLIWGFYYAILLLFEKIILFKYINKLNVSFKHIYTLFFVIIGWVIFRIENIEILISFLQTMFSPCLDVHNLNLLILFIGNYYLEFIVAIVASLPLIPFIKKKINLNSLIIQNIINFCSILIFILSIAYLIGSTYNPFIYFRF